MNAIIIILLVLVIIVLVVLYCEIQNIKKYTALICQMDNNINSLVSAVSFIYTKEPKFIPKKIKFDTFGSVLNSHGQLINPCGRLSAQSFESGKDLPG